MLRDNSTASQATGRDVKYTQGLTNAQKATGPLCLMDALDKRIKKGICIQRPKWTPGFVNKLAAFLFDDESFVFVLYRNECGSNRYWLQEWRQLILSRPRIKLKNYLRKHGPLCLWSFTEPQPRS